MSFDERDCGLWDMEHGLWIEEYDIQSHNEKRFVRSLKKSGESDLIPIELSDIVVMVVIEP